MDFVRAELASFGGRISISSESGRGTRFTLYLPMTLAVAQVVLVGIGGRRYAIPAGMVEQVRRYRPAVLLAALTDGIIEIPPVGSIVLRPLTQLLGGETTPSGAANTSGYFASGATRLAIAVDECRAIRSRGQKCRRTGRTNGRHPGATILVRRDRIVINPVQLITRAPEPPSVSTSRRMRATRPRQRKSESIMLTELSTSTVPTVMVVDDSLTVRRVTQRF